MPCHERRVGIRHDRSRIAVSSGTGSTIAGIDRAVAQHRQEIARPTAARRTFGGIRHAGHVSFFERDPFRRVESDAKLIGKQRTDPHSRRRRIGANADAAGRQIVRSDAAALRSQMRCGRGLRLNTTTGSRRSGTPRERAIRNVMSAIRRHRTRDRGRRA